MDKTELMNAVRSFRSDLDVTQTELARELGRGMSTIQRWEQVVPPKGKALADLANLAAKKKLPAWVSVFDAALSAEMGGEFDINNLLHKSILIELYRSRGIHWLDQQLASLVADAKKGFPLKGFAVKRGDGTPDREFHLECLEGMLANLKSEAGKLK